VLSRADCTTASVPLLLPCQKSHNSTEGYPAAEPVPVKLTASAQRTAFALQVNVTAMCEQCGLDQVGFLTLTFAEHLLDPREAQRRLNSLTTHVLRPRYGQAIRVFERQKSGGIHYHLLIALGADIRTGVDFAEFERDDYRSAPPLLRAEWSFWRRTAQAYGFGRSELLPVKSTSEAIACYMGKYIGKHLDQRDPRDRGVRLVSYCGPRTASTRFGWAGGKSYEWRLKVKAFATMLCTAGVIASPSMSAMRLRFGPRWANQLRNNIMMFPYERQTAAPMAIPALSTAVAKPCATQSRAGAGAPKYRRRI
jgi:hypothetical protein